MTRSRRPLRVIRASLVLCSALSCWALLARAYAQDDASASATPAEGATPADGGQAAEKAPEEDEPRLEVRGTVAWISAARSIFPVENAANPRNEVFRIAQLGAQTELRPNLRLDYGDFLTGIVQPRFVARGELVRVDDDWREQKGSLEASILQLYASFQVNDSFTLAYGYQNFQWGPAELLSPSNRMFPVVNFQRDPLFVVPGRNIVRTNVSVGKSLSLVLLAEVLPSKQVTFEARERFSPQGLAKLEWMREDGSSYLGVTSGAGNHSRAWFGEYGSFGATDALALYCDASHTQGSRAWRPAVQPDGTVAFAKPWARSHRIRTLADCGASFTFEQGTELRAEYIYNDAGYTREDLANARKAILVPNSRAAWADVYLAPGLQLLAKHALFGSLRIPDLPPGRRVTLVARYLASATDQSGAAFAVLTVDATDALVLFASGTATHGPVYGEQSRLVSSGVVAGATYSM